MLARERFSTLKTLSFLYNWNLEWLPTIGKALCQLLGIQTSALHVKNSVVEREENEGVNPGLAVSPWGYSSASGDGNTYPKGSLRWFTRTCEAPGTRVLREWQHWGWQACTQTASLLWEIRERLDLCLLRGVTEIMVPQAVFRVAVSRMKCALDIVRKLMLLFVLKSCCFYSFLVCTSEYTFEL